MMRSVIRMFMLLAVSAVVGVGYAHYRGLPLKPDLRQIEKHKDQYQQWVEDNSIDLDEFVRHFEMGGLVLDARPHESYEQGHLDADQIMHIPADEAVDGYHIERVLPYQCQPIVLYCSSELCDSAEALWNVLYTYGFYEVRVYQPGYDGIEAAGLPTVTGPDVAYALYMECAEPNGTELDGGSDED